MNNLTLLFHPESVRAQNSKTQQTNKKTKALASILRILFEESATSGSFLGLEGRSGLMEISSYEGPRSLRSGLLKVSIVCGTASGS